MGRITGAHGIRGDVVVHAHTRDPADLASYGPLTDKTGARQFEITHLRVTAKSAVVRFKNIADRTTAEALRGTELYVDRSALPKPEDGEYYHVDLIGLRAVEPNGSEIGHVIAIHDFGGGTLLEVSRSRSEQTELVPFTDTFVPTVDIPGGQIVVVLPEMIGEPEKTTRNDGDG